jgi:hypothetical protein
MNKSTIILLIICALAMFTGSIFVAYGMGYENGKESVKFVKSVYAAPYEEPVILYNNWRGTHDIIIPLKENGFYPFYTLELYHSIDGKHYALTELIDINKRLEAWESYSVPEASAWLFNKR